VTPTPTEASFEEALLAAEPHTGCESPPRDCYPCQRIRAAHARELAAARTNNSDHDWRRQMKAYGFDSVEAVLRLVAAARAETRRRASNCVGILDNKGRITRASVRSLHAYFMECAAAAEKANP
jgi:hypothetical protein